MPVFFLRHCRLVPPPINWHLLDLTYKAGLIYTPLWSLSWWWGNSLGLLKDLLLLLNDLKFLSSIFFLDSSCIENILLWGELDYVVCLIFFQFSLFIFNIWYMCFLDCLFFTLLLRRLVPSSSTILHYLFLVRL